MKYLLLLQLIILIHCCKVYGFLNLRAYINCGFFPKVILDVGANVGDFSRGFHQDWPNATIFMVEGNEECREKLVETGFDFEIALVGETVRNVTYYRSNNKYGMYVSYAIYFIISMYILLFPSCYLSFILILGTGNSILKENTIHFEADRATPVTIEMNTIDNIVAKNNLMGNVDMIKVDVQGAEYYALLGAPQTMKHAEMFMAEVSVLQYNKGTPSFHKLQTLLHSYGYALYDIGQVYRSSEQRLIQFDAIWVKRNSKMWSEECTGFPTPHFHSY
jgi:hypothetical protein